MMGSDDESSLCLVGGRRSAVRAVGRDTRSAERSASVGVSSQGPPCGGTLGQVGLERPAHIRPVEWGEVVEVGEVRRSGFGSSHVRTDDRRRRYFIGQSTGNVKSAKPRRSMLRRARAWAGPATLEVTATTLGRTAPSGSSGCSERCGVEGRLRLDDGADRSSVGDRIGVAVRHFPGVSLASEDHRDPQR